MYLLVAVNTGVTPTVSDSYSNTYTLVTSGSRGAGSADYLLYRCIGFTGGAGHTFTSTNGSAASTSIMAIEVLGALSSSQDGALTVFALDATPPLNVSITTTQSGEFVLIVNSSDSSTGYASPATAALILPSTAWALNSGWDQPASAGAQNYSFGTSSANGVIAAISIKDSTPADNTTKPATLGQWDPELLFTAWW